jgi:hypothetical protein
MGAARALLWLLDPPFHLYQVGLGCTDLTKKVFPDLSFSQKKEEIPCKVKHGKAQKNRFVVFLQIC